MSDVSSFLKSVIVQEGPITVRRFVEIALSGRSDSYYMRQDPFGASGDFITAPEISQVFGECIGLWCVDLWHKLGSPPSFRLVEAGPGRGTLMADVLRAGKVSPAFLHACRVSLVEVSPVLRDIQARTLSALDPSRLEWRKRVDDVGQDLPLIVLANEFFDALPARQFVRTPDGWAERVVGLDKAGAFSFGLARGPDLAALVAPQLGAAPTGSVYEYCGASVDIASVIGRAIALRGGAVLAIDYGYEGPATGDTLQALRSHQRVPVLENAGDRDLTFHVDFTALGDALRRTGCETMPVTGQGDFLARLGALERTETLKRHATRAQVVQLDNALKRLTSPEGMGTLFKVLCAMSPASLSPAGFSDR